MIIKFRAWKIEGEYSRMLTTNQAVMTAIKNCYDGVGVAEGTTGYHYADTTLKPQKYILMQSTGLKDKNGVEIFEGDVLYYIPFESHINDSIVVFEKGSFCKKMLRNGKLTSVKFIDSEEYEVIGNIHENPELLEVK